VAKVTITIEDRPNGMVEMKMDPTGETLIKKQVSGEGLTSAEGYALALANRAREISKQPGNIVVGIPRIGRR